MEQGSPVRVALTGSTGFVGSKFLSWAKAQGWTITPLLRGASLEDMSNALVRDECEVVIHLASLFIGEHQPSQVGDLIKSNVEFGAWVLEATRAAKISRFVNVGTDWQDFKGERGCPANLYAATKSAFECILRFYQDAHAMSVYHLKLTDTFGADDPREKILPKLAGLRQDERLSLSPGEQTLLLTAVDDVVGGLAQAAQLVATEQGPCYYHYSLATNEGIRLRDLVKLVEAERGQSLAVDLGARPYRAREVMQPALLDQSLPGWAPRTNLRDGLRAILKARSGESKHESD